MKKILVMLLACFAFCGCEEEVDLVNAMIPGQTWEFPAVDGGAPFRFTLIRQNEYNGKEWYSTSTEEESDSKRLLVIATYKSNWPSCSTHAPYFDRLAGEFKDKGVEFAIIFIDFELSDVINLPWIQDLNNVRAFYNQQTKCQSKYGLCGEVLESFALNSPDVHFVAKERAHLYPSFAAWPDTNDKEKLEATYKKMAESVQKFIDKYGEQ